MFEKDLYALIRGLRNHKGDEDKYIQDSIRECRKEVKSQDMDQKATALLKLIYLEMFGHDMSWASFNVLEVMSSTKYPQKRVGYLGATQTFRPDTDVLVLAENLLKKDLGSVQPPNVALALATIPHVVNANMANSLLSDLLPRLTHLNPAIRKKTIVTLYRLALVYPETLRIAWPQIKERLLDEQEHVSVTAAVVNVVCELGWQRPHDFLPLAPRLFDLLVSGGNNWMAIKIIKLFAVLTPVEPRLVRKLITPLTNLIKTTPAMSLLYECINGIIIGGIIDGSQGTTEGDDIARLCVSKLRGMLVVAGDPNLKYVALLALARIVASHPQLVSEHSDVILECIDDPDISIKSRALDLIAGMVDSSNLLVIVEQLLGQLRQAMPFTSTRDTTTARPPQSAESDDDEAANVLSPSDEVSTQPSTLPDTYRATVIHKILDLCSQNTYSEITDFEWYVGVVVELIRHCPTTSNTIDSDIASSGVADRIGQELVNLAVRVKSVRSEVVAAAQSLLLLDKRQDMFPPLANSANCVLAHAAWIAGEYANLLPDPEAVLASLTHPTSLHLSAHILSIYLQAIPKLFICLTSNVSSSWTPARKSQVVLLAARIVHFFEALVLHHDLTVQERAVEFLELMRIASDAATSQHIDTEDEPAVAPLLLTHALPALFQGQELNPMAPGALRKVPLTNGLDLDTSINPDLQTLLDLAGQDTDDESDRDEAYTFYNEQSADPAVRAVASDLLKVPGNYIKLDTASRDAESLARLKAQRRERHRDDPFYIAPDQDTETVSRDDELDVDIIPITNLSLEPAGGDAKDAPKQPSRKPKSKSKKRVEIVADETLAGDDPLPLPRSSPMPVKRQGLLSVDSSAIGSLSLLDDSSSTHGPNGSYHNATGSYDEHEEASADAEMKQAMIQVERMRLEMQRSSERISGPDEGTIVKRKKKRKVVAVDGSATGAANSHASAVDGNIAEVGGAVDIGHVGMPNHLDVSEPGRRETDINGRNATNVEDDANVTTKNDTMTTKTKTKKSKDNDKSEGKTKVRKKKSNKTQAGDASSKDALQGVDVKVKRKKKRPVESGSLPEVIS